jgi:heptosyltransferase I
VNLLLIRTSALGDIVHTLPVLMALRQALPEARIGWVVEEAFAPLLAGHPALDEVIPVGLRPWRRSLLAGSTRRAACAAVRRLRSFRPDVAVELMGNHKGAFLARLSGAPRRLGAARRQRREPSSTLWLNESVEMEGLHAVDRALSLVRPLLRSRQAGATPAAPEGQDDPIASFGGALLPAASDDEIRAAVGAHAMPRILIQPGAGWGNKRYPPEAWGEVARRLDAATGSKPGVLAAPGEEHLAARVVAAGAGSARILPAAGIPLLVGLLRQGSLVLGGDTGPLHLAHALGTSVLMVMGPTDPERHGPYRAPSAAVAHRLPCSFCYKRYSETKACLLEIPPHEVAAAALSLLSP